MDGTINILDLTAEEIVDVAKEVKTCIEQDNLSLSSRIVRLSDNLSNLIIKLNEEKACQ